MRVISALPGQAHFGVQLARILRLTEHSTRVQRMPDRLSLRLKKWKEENERAKRLSVGEPTKTRRRYRTPHALAPVAPAPKPARPMIRVKGTGSWRPASTKLTEEKVRAIWADLIEYRMYHGAFVEIGKKHGVNRRTVRDIWTGRTWSYLFREQDKPQGKTLFDMEVGQ